MPGFPPSQGGEHFTTITSIINRYSERDKRRELRNNATEAKVRLWLRLKGSQVAGCKFRRQISIGVYVLDFYCSGRKLAIELDGSSHDGADAQEYDSERQRYIEALDIRFSNDAVYHDLEQVITMIERSLTAIET